jgi:hypothetical protein
MFEAGVVAPLGHRETMGAWAEIPHDLPCR